MANPAPLNARAIEKAVNGKLAAVDPWVKMTRADTAVTPRTAILHGQRERFDLWESAGRRPSRRKRAAA